MARLFRKLTVLAGAAEAARRYARKNPEKVARMAENAGRFVDKKTHGKYHSQIENAVRKVRTQRPATTPVPGGHHPV
jgi:MT0933-like antitoxin protein